jgi:hypothetical protein
VSARLASLPAEPASASRASDSELGPRAGTRLAVLPPSPPVAATLPDWSPSRALQVSGFVHTHETAGDRGHLRYTICVGPQGGAGSEACLGWRVDRRFSQFVEVTSPLPFGPSATHARAHRDPSFLTRQLHAALKSLHGAAMARCDAHLPSRFHLPSSVEAEGAQRIGPLGAYLSRLMRSVALRRSQQLLYFVGAQSPARRRLWAAAAGAGEGGAAAEPARSPEQAGPAAAGACLPPDCTSFLEF